MILINQKKTWTTFNAEHNYENNQKQSGSIKTCSNFIIGMRESKPTETTQNYLPAFEAT